MPEKSNELEKIKSKLAEIDRKLDQLLKLQTEPPYTRAFVPKTLASLPEHLRKTALAIATMGQATAEQVAAKTGRTRAAESDYLNQLTSRGFLKKERIGREVHFLVFALYAMCPQCGARVPMTLDHCPMCGVPLSKKQ
jgi:response regulator of citrate/malate metabolism